MGKLLEKNIKLSDQLADFIATNPKVMKEIPSGATLVAFSSSDEKINKLNSKLVKMLTSEGKKVVKAKQKASKTKPWSFTTAY